MNQPTRRAPGVCDGKRAGEARGTNSRTRKHSCGAPAFVFRELTRPSSAHRDAFVARRAASQRTSVTFWAAATLTTAAHRATAPIAW